MLQSYFSGNRWITYPGSIFLVLILFGPFIAIIADTIVSLIQNPDNGISLVLPSGRRTTLFLRTIGLGLWVSIAGMITGLTTATVLWRWNRGRIRHLRWLILVFAAIPPYIHALAWADLMSPVTVNGWWTSWWVQLMSFLPITTGMALIGLESVNTGLVNAARVMRSDAGTFRKIVFPAALPAVVTGGIILFLLSITDYSVPSLFRINVYAIEIFAEFSSTGNPSKAFLLSLPVILCALIGIIVLSGSLKRILFSTPGNKQGRLNSFFWPSWIRVLQILAMLILLLQVLVPLFNIVFDISSIDHLLKTVTNSSGEIFYSIMVAASAALISLPLGWLGVRLVTQKRSFGLWWLILFIPMIFPPALTGIGLISIWNRPILSDIYNSWMILVLADLSRFLPVSVLVMFITLKQINLSLLDAARIIEKRPGRILYRITLPLVIPGLIATAFVVFVLSLGELGASILLAPPGKSTISMTIFNYLHYGESSTVAGLSLLMVLITLIAGLLIYLLLARLQKLKT